MIKAAGRLRREAERVDGLSTEIFGRDDKQRAALNWRECRRALA